MVSLFKKADMLLERPFGHRLPTYWTNAHIHLHRYDKETVPCIIEVAGYSLMKVLFHKGNLNWNIKMTEKSIYTMLETFISLYPFIMKTQALISDSDTRLRWM